MYCVKSTRTCVSPCATPSSSLAPAGVAPVSIISFRPASRRVAICKDSTRRRVRAGYSWSSQVTAAVRRPKLISAWTGMTIRSHELVGTMSPKPSVAVVTIERYTASVNSVPRVGDRPGL